jgi:para-nitrobenzyl esterase
MTSRKNSEPQFESATRRSILQGGASMATLGMMGGIASVSAQPTGEQPGATVTIASGKVQGVHANGVDIFRGIPYGASTAGSGRFALARPAEPWTGVKQAVTFGPTAPQIFPKRGPQGAWYYTSGPASEDCLVLNVFTPSVERSAKRPVMVWIHGGGFAVGMSSSKGFEGSNLAKAGDVVVVSLNHRLNIFGHLYLGSIGGERFADSGNNGSLDIVAALRWIKTNIAEFGGDPDNVTLFGQSGGASYIATLYAMPSAQGLFHKVIMESFSSGLKMGRPETAQAAGEIVLKHLDIGRNELKKLEDVPMDRMLAAMNATIKEVGVDNFRAIVDGRSLPHDPFTPDALALYADIPMIIGNTEHEATSSLSANPKNYEMTREQAIDRAAAFVGIDKTSAQALYASFEQRHPGRPIDTYIAIQSNHMYRRNDIRAAELKARQGRAPVFAYLWSWQTPVMPGTLKAMHTIEVPFVFGNTALVPEFLGNGSELKSLTEAIQGAWVAFARNGNPNHAKLAEWKPFTIAGRETMVFDMPSKLVSDPHGEDLREINKHPAYDPEARRPG